MSRLTEKGVRYCEKENAEMHKEQLTHIYEFYEKIGKMENKLRELEDLMEHYHIRNVEELDRVLEEHYLIMLGKRTPHWCQQIKEEDIK